MLELNFVEADGLGISNFGHYLKLTQCLLHISYQSYSKSCHLILILVKKCFKWRILSQTSTEESGKNKKI